VTGIGVAGTKVPASVSSGFRVAAGKLQLRDRARAVVAGYESGQVTPRRMSPARES